MEILERSELREKVFAFALKRLSNQPPGMTFDLVNLDRGWEGGLVYYHGAIVRRRSDGQILDGRQRLSESDPDVEIPVVEVGDDPVDGATYVPAGPVPDYVVDRGSRTILIGTGRGDCDATLDELQDAVTRAFDDFFPPSPFGDIDLAKLDFGLGLTCDALGDSPSSTCAEAVSPKGTEQLKDSANRPGKKRRKMASDLLAGLELLDEDTGPKKGEKEQP